MLLLLAFSAAFAGLLGFALHMKASQLHGQLVLAFDTAAHSNGVLQGEAYEIPFEMRNTGDIPITITEIHKSCACISLVDNNKKPLAVPVHIPGRKAVGGFVSVSTGTKQGLSVEPFKVNYTMSGSAFSSVSKLDLLVCASPHSITGPVVLSSEQLKGEATIGDAFPVGVEFSSVKFDSRWIKSATIERTGKLSPLSPRIESTPSGPCKVSPTHTLRVEGIKADNDQRSYITLVPSDSSREPYRVPVHYRADVSARWRIIPPVISFQVENGTSQVRSAHVMPPESRRMDIPNLRLVASNTELLVIGKQVGGLYAIEVALKGGSTLSKDESVDVFCGPAEKVGSLVIKSFPKINSTPRD